MTLTSRYRPGAVRTPFVDREDVLDAVNNGFEVSTLPRPVIALTGVGGIGKSRLLHEVARRASSPGGEGRSTVGTAILNLQEPAQRAQLAALGTLRMQYGVAGVRFDRFDVAYAVWWQRLNPHIVLDRDRFPLARASEAIGEVLSEVSSVPIFGSAVRVVEILARRLKRWKVIRHDATLQELDVLSHDQLGDAVTYLFAQDLNAHGQYLLCVDAYEALMGGGVARRASFVDSWLRDLVWQLNQGLVVVASREPLNWHRHHPQWLSRVQEMPVMELPFDARIELLEALGMATGDMAHAIAEQSAGVPYYLHLAHEAGPGADAFPRLEERFLHHVEPDMVRLLELLSAARLFDREVFGHLASHFGLRADVITWETLIGFSFVSSAGAETLQLHQLMAQAIQARLSVPVQQELHQVLHEAWRRRANTGESAHAWREAAYHAARMAMAPVAELAEYADRIVALEGQIGLRALLADLPDDCGPEVVRLRRLWQAEAALLVGDAESALSDIASVRAELPSDADEVDARVAVAAAHAYRIRGDTSEALARFGEVWSAFAGGIALDAGAWFADLHMAQGRFREAIRVAEDIVQLSAEERPGLRGDVARLLFLTYRFAFDQEQAAFHLGQARQHYHESGHVVGQANVATNTVELLAIADPAAAVVAADEAIVAQQRLRADHELGKTYTALGLAHLGLGERKQATETLDQAVAILERCGYRSGRARAELVRALCHAQAGEPGQAQQSAVWAVAEFEEVEVYPTLVMVAAALLDRIGRPHASVTAAEARATSQVQAPHGIEVLQRAIRDFVLRTVRSRWDGLYAEALASTEVLSGFYHRNVRVGDYLVRSPLPAAPRMDLQVWPEPEVLAVAGQHVNGVPALRFASDDPRYQVHDWIDGSLLDEVAPRGARVPPGVIDACAALFGQLGAVPVAELPPLPADWPAYGDCAGFASRMLAVTREVRARFAGAYGRLWRDLEIPVDPFGPLSLDQLGERPFRLLHCDVHRKNILLAPGGDGSACWFLDWELACLGDPVYDLAVHLHKMGYQPDEEEAACRRWEATCGADDRWPGWRNDLRRYREHEHVKSAVVDSVRYARLVVTDPPQRQSRVASLVAKLTRARRVWGDPSPVDPDRVAAALVAAGAR